MKKFLSIIMTTILASSLLVGCSPKDDGIQKIETKGNALYYGIRIAPEDTKNIEIGNYYYDLEIGLNGDKFTLLNGILKLDKDITNEGGR